MQINQSRKGLIETINIPLGFYALALLIVESFLTSVLIFGNLEAQLKREGMLAGIGLFLFVVTLVSIFVWFKPTHLIYTGYESLVEAGKIPFGTNTREVPPDKLGKGVPSIKEED